MRRYSTGLACFVAFLGAASSARADRDIKIPEIVVVEFGDPYYVGTFSVFLNPDTKFVAGTSQFKVFTPPDIQLFGASGPSDRPWQAVPDVSTNTVAYSLFNGGPTLDITVPPAPVGSPLDLGTFKFTTYATTFNYPATLVVQAIGLQTASGTPLATQTYNVPVRFVPEPSALLLMGLGLAGCAGACLRLRGRRPTSAG
ncbi:MAG: PEP-CTERM sorting domain-containing protein [Isosphaeraceae bacterium]